MSTRLIPVSFCCGIALATASSSSAVTFNVDTNDVGCSDVTGTPYCTIEAAVAAAALLDDPAAEGNPDGFVHPDPVEIVVFAGTYSPSDVNHTVDIPADPSGQLNSLNDFWTIRNNPGDKVVLDGRIVVRGDRDHVTIDGINVNMGAQSFDGIDFRATGGVVKNLAVYGGSGVTLNAGIKDNAGAGVPLEITVDHVTVFGNSQGIFGNNTAFNITNSIVAFNDRWGLRNFSSDPSPYSYSDIHGNGIDNYQSDGIDGDQSHWTDAGNNLNVPDGLDPIFASTNPTDPNFLFLVPNSPCAGSASTAGSMTNGELNMGAFPVAEVPPATLGACCLPDSTCVETTSAGCTTIAGDYQGDSTDCGTTVCSVLLGSCCLPDGSCIDGVVEEDCTAQGGTFNGGGTDCGSTICVPDTAACCLPDGTCSDLSEADCAAQNGLLQGFPSSCANDGAVCSNTGACCLSDETCLETNEADCGNVQEGVYQGDGEACTSALCQRTFEVGPGKEFATIQAAVDAAAALDDPAATSNPVGFVHPNPVNIVVFEGVYEELDNPNPGVVLLPTDPSGQTRSLNDFWTIRNNPGDTVVLTGRFTVQPQRDSITIDGININTSLDSNGNAIFTDTSVRFCTIKNLWITGGITAGTTGAGFQAARAAGTNVVDHVTIFAQSQGILGSNNSPFDIKNSIIVFNDRWGLRNFGTASQVSFSDVHGNGIDNYQSDGNDGDLSLWIDSEGNLNIPDGLDPMFLSTDLTDPDFLRLDPASPCAGTANSAGSMTNGELNMGALPSGPAPPGTVGACCLDDGTCGENTLIGCGLSQGSFAGEGTTCATVDCTVGACCAVDGTCSITTEADCVGDSVYQGNGVSCASASCPFIRPDPVFDRDVDGDVDAEDFAKFQLCLTGQGGGVPAGCEDFDRPEPVSGGPDNDIDENDFKRFLACANTSGPDIPADVTCDDLQACCLAGGGCQDLVPGICEDPQGANGTAQGVNTDCASTVCP